MADKHFETDDPMELMGVVLPADLEATRDMAYVFAEEFARVGHGAEQLLSLFKHPFYAGAHGAYRTLGEEAIRAIVAECVAVWGQARFSILDSRFSTAEEKQEGHSPDPAPIQNPKSKIENEGPEE
jgi:hypothetical protein